MKRPLLALLFAFFADSILPASAVAAQRFDADVFGRYEGFLRVSGRQSYSSAFSLRFTESLRISASYRFRRVRIRESYRLFDSGRYVGVLKARGRALTRISHTPKRFRRRGAGFVVGPRSGGRTG